MLLKSQHKQVDHVLPSSLRVPGLLKEMATSSAQDRPSLASTIDNNQGELGVIIRFSGNKTYFINTNCKQTVKDLKKLVAKEANISSNHLNFVLAGHLLNDLALLQDCGLGAHTTLHAFCWSDDGLGAGDLTVRKHTDKSEHDVTPQTSACPGSCHTGDLTVQGQGFDRDESHYTNSSPGSSMLGSDVDGDYLHRRSRSTVAEVRPALCQPLARQNDHCRFFVFCKLCDCVRPAKLRLSCKECGSGAFLVERGPSNWEDISTQTTIRGTCKAENCPGNTPRFFLRCSQSHEGEVDGTAVVLKHVQANRKRVECIICGDVMSHVLIFPCLPGHVICLECFRQYGSTCLSERRFIEHAQHGYTLPCPAGCEDSHIEESHHFLLMGPEKYERYKNFGAEEYVLQNGGILCPALGCGMGLFPEGDERLIKCGECQFESCKDCRRAYHGGTCQNYQESLHLSSADLAITDERADRACWERESLSLIEETTKACPGCRTKTERSGGCMHMICSRCGQEWCWICVKAWTRECQADHWFG